MCGIVGYHGGYSASLLKDMVKTIKHRGPDNDAFFDYQSVGLGHVRLSIIDLSPLSDQPMTSRCGMYVITFNGEIYNYKALRQELILAGVKLRTKGDAEVLLELWVREGKACLEKLDGIFSFAVYCKITNDVYLVRDHLGVKPLYYSVTRSGILFASEIKALLVCDEVIRDIDLMALKRTLRYLWSPGEHTLLRCVKKVLPGTMLHISEGKIKKNIRYYQPPDYQGYLFEDNPASDAVDQVNAVLERSVQSQLVADVKVGAFLSGGLDSSLICSIAKKHSPEFRDVFSISINKDENKKDGVTEDLPYARSVAKDLALNLNVVHAGCELAELLPRAIYYLDEPQADPAILNVYAICQLAREKGIKVLLSGAGGDDIFTGYRRHYACMLDQRMQRMPNWLGRILYRLSRRVKVTHPLLRRSVKFLSTFSKSGNEKIFEYFSWLDESMLNRLLRENTEFCDSHRTSDLFEERLDNLSASNVEKCLILERDFFLVDHNFNYTDKMSMAHGIEVRVPFATKDVLDVASKIPTRLKQKGKIGKWILKKAAEKWLSKKVIYRPKTGFGAPLRGWLHGPLKHLLEEILSEESVKRRGLFNYDVIREMIKDDREGICDYAYPIYALLTLEIWFRQFVDFKTPKPLTIQELVSGEVV